MSVPRSPHWPQRFYEDRLSSRVQGQEGNRASLITIASHSIDAAGSTHIPITLPGTSGTASLGAGIASVRPP